MPTNGKQCMLFSPGGDPATGLIVTGIFSNTHPAPSDDPNLCRRTYPDGAVIEYDHAAHRLQSTISLSATRDAKLTSP
ncbi:phage baseplate assembly protein V [Salinisphaera sp. T5B8]|uniref:phage baseplate assembly protein V n=1 Tax=Salinisphaera sp. T5B8 TaxID=1304154 RepID=UPI00334023B5